MEKLLHHQLKLERIFLPLLKHPLPGYQHQQNLEQVPILVNREQLEKKTIDFFHTSCANLEFEPFRAQVDVEF